MTEAYESEAPEEWRPTLASDPLRQGDILRSLDEQVDLWRANLIVVTADCDLAHNKHGGSLSTVPVIDHRDYLRLFRSERLSNRTEERIVARIQALLSSLGPGSAVISDQRLSAWLVEETTEALVHTLGFTDDAAASTLTSLVGAFQDVRGSRSAELHHIVEANARAKHLLGDGKSPEVTRRAISKELIESIQSLPGDAMFLAAIAPDRVDGSVVYLRRIIEIPDASVATTMSDRGLGATYVRTGRLTAPYIYALTQQLGAVFSAIGLPVAYEQERKRIAECLTFDTRES